MKNIRSIELIRHGNLKKYFFEEDGLDWRIDNYVKISFG